MDPRSNIEQLRVADWLIGGGAMGRLIQSTDWSRTPLGSLETWPASLRLAVGICTSSRFPMFVWWGTELVNLYNDAYVPILGKRHPDALGRPAREIWRDIWPVIGPQTEAVMERGEATWNERVHLAMERNGYVEDVYVTWSYSPIRDEQGKVGGLFCACTEETGRVQAEERISNILTSITDGFFALDHDWRFSYVNPECERILGKAGDELIGRSLWDVYPGTVGSEFERAYRKAVTERVAVSFTSYYPDHDRWYEVRAFPSPDGVSIYFRDETERKRAEIALRESEQRFRMLADTAPAILWMTAPDATCSFLSRGWYDFTGQTEANALGLGWLDAVHPDDRASSGKIFLAANGKREPFALEHRVRRVDGEYRWVIDAGRPRLGVNDEYLGFIGSVIDIHDRKRLEDALAAEKRVLEEIATGATRSAVLAMLIRGIETQSADGMRCSVLMLDEAGERLLHAAAPSLPDAYNKAIDGIRIGPGVGSCGTAAHERRVVCVTDIATDPLWASFKNLALSNGLSACYSNPILSGNDRVLGTVAMYYPTPHVPSAHDRQLIESATHLAGIVFERDQAEQAIHAAGERLRFMAESMPQKIFTATPAGDVDYFNEQWMEFTGLSFEQIRDWGWTQFIHPDDVEENVRSWKHSVATGEPFQLEHRFRRHDGEYRWHLSRANAMRDAEGNIVTWTGSNTEIDDVKRAGEEREKLLDSERAARAEAERAGRVKDEFLATLSHEIRTPLNAILGWSQIMRRSANPDDIANGLGVIERNARAQSQIIEDLLDMSRIISGKVRLDVQRVDLSAIVQTAVETARPTAEAKSIRLKSVIDPLYGVAVSGDVNRLQQVLWNLISNAVKFTPKGGRVQVLLERVNSHLEISVIDTGEGIAPEFLPFVFDRFRQADASTTRRHGGLGLGLSIVKQLVELHGGSVRVNSAGTGHGTTFVVALPLIALHPESERETERRHPRAIPKLNGMPDSCSEIEGVRVLVIDDEPDARALVTRLLEDCKAVVTATDSTDEAVRLIGTGSFDVLVSDIGMPHEDGYSLIRRVRRLGKGRGGDIPAIALTAYARAEDRVKAVAAGFMMHVAKPVEPMELVTMVAGAAGRTGPADG